MFFTFLKNFLSSKNKIDYLEMPSIWFGGITILITFLLNFFSEQNHNSEYIIYLSVFLISVVIFLLSFNLKINFKFINIFSIFFYIFIIFNLIISFDLIAIFIISVILYLLFLKNNNLFKPSEYIKSLFILSFTFYITFKIIYWEGIIGFIVPDSKILDYSSYIPEKYLNFYLEFLVSDNYIFFLKFLKTGYIFYIVIIFLIFGYLLSVYNEKKINKKNYFLYISPVIIVFFLESFSTYNFFNKIGGGAMAHWQVLIGPIELMKEGGYLLWDVPSQYGFLSMLSVYILPFDSSWQSFYFLNSLMVFTMSMLIFLVIWNNKNLHWYIISLFLSLSIIFYLNAGTEVDNVNLVPSDGAFRYFWIVLILFMMFKMGSRDPFSQFLIILPVWIVGFLWSPESAFYVTAAISPMLFNYIINKDINIRKKLFVFLLFPISILFFIIFISIFYLINIGQFPDYYSFVEYIFSWTGGNPQNSKEKFNYQGPIIFLIFFLSIFFTMYFQNIKNKNSYLIFSVIFSLGAISSYLVGQSEDININSQIVFYIFGYFLIINYFKINKKYYHIISPVILTILIASYGNLSTIKHFTSTILNQDYFLKKSIYEEPEGFNEILTISDVNKEPVIFTEVGRYLIYATQDKYSNLENEEVKKINTDVWIPYKPASLYEPLTPARRKIYLSRWIQRKNTSEGWYIGPVSEHWHDSVEKSLFEVLEEENYIIKKEKKTNIYKALLFKKL